MKGHRGSEVYDLSLPFLSLLLESFLSQGSASYWQERGARWGEQKDKVFSVLPDIRFILNLK